MPRAVALDGEGPAPSTEAVLATAACGRQSRLSVVGHQNGLKATPHLFHDMRQRETSLQKAAGRPCQVLCLPGALLLWREAAPGVTSWLRPAGRPPARPVSRSGRLDQQARCLWSGAPRRMAGPRRVPCHVAICHGSCQRR